MAIITTGDTPQRLSPVLFSHDTITKLRTDIVLSTRLEGIEVVRAACAGVYPG